MYTPPTNYWSEGYTVFTLSVITMPMHHTKTRYQIFTLAVALSAVCFGGLTTFAEETATGTPQNNASSSRRETVLENQAARAEAMDAREASSTERQEIREERQTERVEVREERRASLASFRQDRIINLAANISNRMDAATERLFNLIGRLESRMQKMEQNGYNTGAAAAKLREASQTLAEAKTAMADIDALVYAATTSEQPRSNWQAVRERYVVVGGLIRQTHTELREALSLLKTAVIGGASALEENETSTSSATSTETGVIEVI